jgi:hypothetical protein
MGTTIKGAVKILAVFTASAALVGVTYAQNTLQFTSVNATPENAIQLHWASNSNEVYEIDEADSLIDTNTGTITWNTLYENLPSQGTNTFYLDTGNYFADTTIVHPGQSPMRFYRVVLTGSNSAPTVPLVSLSTNGIADDGTVSVVVTASTDQAFLQTKLYVDGQEMNDPDDSTNWTDDSGITNYIQDTYIINTCEWPNGAHTLFGTASCQTGPSGTHDVPDVGISYGVSLFLPVTFSNLITRISFSQPFFAPEDGETQQVSAIFTANVDWTLQIEDVSNNPVRTVTGSGGSLLFNWDGTDDSSNDVPVGNYTYLITAETNGLALPVGGGSSGTNGGSPPFPSMMLAGSDATQLWALSPNSLNPFPFAIYPPGMDTNGFAFFEEPIDWSPIDDTEVASEETSFAQPNGAGAGGSSQNSRAPKRPPINPVKGRAGVYGLAYDTYSADGINGFQTAPPLNGVLSQRVLLEGKTTVALSTFTYPPLRTYKQEANGFISAMKKGNWSQGFAKVDDQFAIADLKGAGTMYNTVKLGLLMGHGTYGTAQDFTAGGCEQMYFPITAGHSAQYLRLSEMNLGNSVTNGLSWMAIAACNSLRQSQWVNMQNSGVHPYNSGLHLLLGTDSVVYTDDHIMQKWAQYMTKGKGTNAPMTIGDAWINAAKDAYAATKFNYVITMKFAVAGDSACLNDKMSSTSTPGGSWSYTSTQVYPQP